ncbi:MAG TPA: phosphoenolpyruvate carboxylase, partial [Nitrospiria bacterium]|nr:phosphoenolpyruvate carboxylase [Nitrospiria bacterium]
MISMNSAHHTPYEMDRRLQSDILHMETLLSKVILEQEGEELLLAIQKLRKICRDLRDHYDLAMEEALIRFVEGMDLSMLAKVIRAFDISFHLLNVVEENFAMQERREAQKSSLQTWIHPLEESFRLFSKSLKDPDAFPRLLDKCWIEPVMTAHPTEAKRQTILEKYRKIYLLILKKLNPIWTPREV